ncbi:MAG: valine--tRNA ligase [Promethearchaeota archaeon]
MCAKKSSKKSKKTMNNSKTEPTGKEKIKKKASMGKKASSGKKSSKKKSSKNKKIPFKRWDFSFEEEIIEEWKENGVYEKYKFDPNSDKPMFSIDTPPPYPSGKWHIGAVAQYTMIDMIARIQRMRGYNVLFPWGLDRNGINIEFVVEKKYNKGLHEFDREEFISLCREEITKISNEIDRIARRIGCSMDFDNVYMTDSDEYRAVTQRSFIELYNKGYIYEDYRPNNYCPGCQTTIADAEIYYKDGEIDLNYIKFPIEGNEDLNDDNGYIMIATTRPELICACQIVLVHPDDERYKKFHGKRAKLPLYDRSVPIKPHPAAKMEYGSGAVMICSYGDSTDVQLFRELKLEPIVAFDINVKLTDVAGKYKGMTAEEARAAIIEDLDMYGYLDHQERVPHKYPVCERSRDRIEIILLKEYYIKQIDFLDDIRKFADEIKFHPAKNKNILLDWINGITIDWPISRRRYYHTEIPVWKCKKCGAIHLPPPGKYYKPWKEDPPFKDEPCKVCGSTEGYIGETKTFDTWMDSSNSSNYILKYGQDDEFFKKHHPCSIRPQGREIVRTWLYYTLLKNKLLLNKKAFEHVWISGLGMDKSGKKMSKSLGNVIDPDRIIDAYGVDTFRYWAATVSHVGDDFRIDEEKIRNTSKVLTKLFNICKFTSFFPNESEKIEKIQLKPSDKWILAEMNKLIDDATKGYDDFDFIIPAQATRNFAENKFASHYIEMVKARAYEGDISSAATLHTCLKTILKLLHPIIPFMTYKLYKLLYNKDVQFEDYPAKIRESDVSSFIDYSQKLMDFNSEVWKYKHDQKMSLKEAVEKEIPQDLKIFEDDLVRMHNIKKPQ